MATHRLDGTRGRLNNHSQWLFINGSTLTWKEVSNRMPECPIQHFNEWPRCRVAICPGKLGPSWFSGIAFSYWQVWRVSCPGLGNRIMATLPWWEGRNDIKLPGGWGYLKHLNTESECKITLTSLIIGHQSSEINVKACTSTELGKGEWEGSRHLSRLQVEHEREVWCSYKKNLIQYWATLTEV